MSILTKIEHQLLDIIAHRDDIVECSYVLHDVVRDERVMRNSGNAIYPASLIKLWIAAEVLSQIEKGVMDFEYTVTMKNDNENKEDYDNEISKSDYPLLKVSENYSVYVLLHAMLGHSHNGASNELIDLVGRDAINARIISMGFPRHTLTRKFISREKELPEYQSVPAVTGSAFMYFSVWEKIYNKSFVSLFVSEQIKKMCKQVSGNLKGIQFQESGGDVYRKGGWLTSILHNGNVATWEHDSGMWEYENSAIIYSIMTLVKNENGERVGLDSIKI